jgi:multidrug efflux pump subunit AcrB
MVRFLIHRPVAVLMVTAALLIFSLLATRELPVSLLPDTDVPEIVIKVQLPNASPAAIERAVLRPIRESMLTLNGLTAMESRAASESGQVSLRFDYGQPMDLRYVEINEKIDRLSGRFPRAMERPLVIRLNASDIPILRLQILPKQQAHFSDVSELAESVIKKRIEQLEGVSLVDINGLQKRNISVMPNHQQLRQLGMDESALLTAIQSANTELGSISVKDGQYRYYLRMANRLSSVQDIRDLPVALPKGDFIPLHRLARVEEAVDKPVGLHLFGREQAIVMNIHKQSQARMNRVVPLLYDATAALERDFPDLAFQLTQDQSILLNTAIDNLSSSLLLGGSFAFIILFLFMGNYRIPIIMGLSLPLSLLISFLFFHWFGLSINIISLSGLALGLGMLIDNAIIVLDNISRKRQEGLGLFEACISGVNEIMSALISSVLTTLAVFVPLIFLSGVAGALFYDQAMAVAVILSVSLAVAFILLPLLYRLFFAKRSDTNRESCFYLALLRVYHALFQRIFKRPALSFIILVLLIPLALWLGRLLPLSAFPEVEKRDLLVKLDWNEPIDVQTSVQRLLELKLALEDAFVISEADVGLNQYILQTQETTIQQLYWYLLFESREEREKQTSALRQLIISKYPDARVDLMPAPNAFDYLFGQNEAELYIRWRLTKGEGSLSYDQLIAQKERIPLTDKVAGEGLEAQSAIRLLPDYERIRRLGISIDELVDKVNKLFGNYTITELQASDKRMPVVLASDESLLRQRLSNTFISNRKQEGPQQYPLSDLISFEFTTDFKYITADAGGPFYSVATPVQQTLAAQAELQQWAASEGVLHELGGQYFSDRETIRQLLFILMIAIAMLYFILSAQFENFIQPLIVITTLPLGLGGAFLLLWISGQTLNIMSGIGLVVMLGIIVNDAILKIDIINRLRKEKSLMEALAGGGEIRLKPIIMTSVTTILALLPLLFASGLGADLQKPLVISVLGGLTIGTLSSLYYVPLAYHFIEKLKLKS